MAANKKTQNKGEVSIRITGNAEEYKFFNRYTINETSGMLMLSLFYEEDSGSNTIMEVVRGVCSLQDCQMLLHILKPYIAKIGASDFSGDPPFRAPRCTSPPITFQHMGAVCRGNMGEILLSQFSHRNAHEAAQSAHPEIEAKIFGAYTSELSIHKSLIFEFIELTEKALK